MEKVQSNSTETQIEQLKKIVAYAEVVRDRMKDVESVLHVMADSIVTTQELAEEIMLQANTELFDRCV